jgi:hypothetical protein
MTSKVLFTCTFVPLLFLCVLGNDLARGKYTYWYMFSWRWHDTLSSVWMASVSMQKKLVPRHGNHLALLSIFFWNRTALWVSPQSVWRSTLSLSTICMTQHMHYNTISVDTFPNFWNRTALWVSPQSVWRSTCIITLYQLILSLTSSSEFE